MPQLTYKPKNEMVLVVEPTDSMGRNQALQDAMEKNDPKPPKVRGADKVYAEVIAEQCAQYPKAMYRLALKKGVPAGDEMLPSYPLPYDLAQQIGLADKGFKVIGKTKDSGGNIVVRHPYQSTLVGVINPDGTVDLEASKKQEKEHLTKGWVDAVAKIKGLPKTIAEEEFDVVAD